MNVSISDTKTRVSAGSCVRHAMGFAIVGGGALIGVARCVARISTIA